MKRMLINATQAEELRVAIVDGQSLYDLDIEIPSREQKKSNIYKARISRVEPSLEACFVEYGGDRHGFLPLKEVSKEYFQPGTNSKSNIRELLKEGQELLVQVEKEERGNKGAALTTFISLAGRYMVLMPNSPSAGGVSRRVEGEDRAALKEAMEQLELPDGMGLIVRTAGVGRDASELQWDLNYLLQVWSAVEEASKTRSGAFLVYQESKLIIRALRDYLRTDIGEILIDEESLYDEAREFMQQVMPQTLRKLKLYTDEVPLFTRYQIESQIESAFSREVRLPSGGSIVVDHSEALIAIDINSAKATKGSDIEATAFNTNLEASDEVARQLRIRDLGGLIVIDYIDMESQRHQRQVEERLREALKMDRARVQVGRISRFGLMEMSRQRLRPSLGESTGLLCPRCEGHGRIRGVESVSLAILRLLEEEAMKPNTGQVVLEVPVAVGNFLGNEKRTALVAIEERHKLPIILVSNEHLDSPNYKIERVRGSDVDSEQTPSYQRVVTPEVEVPVRGAAAESTGPVAAVSVVRSNTPPPGQPEPEPVPASIADKPLGLWARFMQLISGAGQTAAAAKADTASEQPKSSDSRPRRPTRGKPSGDGRRDRNDRPRRGRGRDRDADGDNRGNTRSGKRDSEKREADEATGNETTRRDGRPKRDEAGSNSRNKSRGDQSQQKVAKADADAEVVEKNIPGADETVGEETEAPRKRRRRGGRRRRGQAAEGGAVTDANGVENVAEEAAAEGSSVESSAVESSEEPQPVAQASANSDESADSAPVASEQPAQSSAPASDSVADESTESTGDVVSAEKAADAESSEEADERPRSRRGRRGRGRGRGKAAADGSVEQVDGDPGSADQQSADSVGSGEEKQAATGDEVLQSAEAVTSVQPAVAVADEPLAPAAVDSGLDKPAVPKADSTLKAKDDTGAESGTADEAKSSEAKPGDEVDPGDKPKRKRRTRTTKPKSEQATASVDVKSASSDKPEPKQPDLLGGESSQADEAAESSKVVKKAKPAAKTAAAKPKPAKRKLIQVETRKPVAAVAPAITDAAQVGPDKKPERSSSAAVPAASEIASPAVEKPVAVGAETDVAAAPVAQPEPTAKAEKGNGSAVKTGAPAEAEAKVVRSEAPMVDPVVEEDAEAEKLAADGAKADEAATEAGESEPKTQNQRPTLN